MSTVAHVTPDDRAREFDERIESAYEALRAGKASALAYTLSVDVEDVARVGGTARGCLGPVDDRSGG